MDLFSTNDSEQAIYLEYTGDKNGNNVPDPNEIGIKPLKGDGDFRSEECIELLKEADIVVTNPPFSLFREYVTQLDEYDKKFLIVGHQNATKYTNIFPLIKENKIWLGYGFKGGAAHFINTHYEDYASAGDHKDGMIRVSGVVWLTNLEITKRYEDLILYKKYTKEDYPKYDNYNAINVDITKDIPMDYSGDMGVPITFLNKYNPEQFEIIGLGQGNLYREFTTKGLTQKFVDDYYEQGNTGIIKEDHPILGYYNSKGNAIIPYMRIIIKNKRL
tara:strand:- start:514 stop:1335 length:822 start_codon:yes stop_codon:yes gene_type:complete